MSWMKQLNHKFEERPVTKSYKSVFAVSVAASGGLSPDEPRRHWFEPRNDHNSFCKEKGLNFSVSDTQLPGGL